MERLNLLLSAEELSRLVTELAERIRADHEGGDIVLVAVLKGSFVFFADLLRALAVPCEVDFIHTASYGNKDNPSDKIDIHFEGGVELAGRDVIVVEDIVDRGTTLKTIVENIRSRGAASIETCSLLVRKGAPAKVDYEGLEIGPGFVVGYGLDHKERYRELRELYVIEKNEGG